MMAVLLAFAAGAAAAEDVQEEMPEESFSEDSGEGLCMHENTETQYYFDFPVYRAVDDLCHAVNGTALVSVVCLDCGEVISVTEENNAEEIRPHVFRFRDHTLGGQGPCVIHHLVIARELSAHEGLEPGTDIAHRVHSLDRTSFDQTQCLKFSSGNSFSSCQDHLLLHSLSPESGQLIHIPCRSPKGPTVFQTK